MFPRMDVDATKRTKSYENGVKTQIVWWYNTACPKKIANGVVSQERNDIG